MTRLRLAQVASGLVSLGMGLSLGVILWEGHPFSTNTASEIALTPILLGIVLAICITDNLAPERRWLKNHWLRIVQITGFGVLFDSIWILRMTTGSILVGYVIAFCAAAGWLLSMETFIRNQALERSS